MDILIALVVFYIVYFIGICLSVVLHELGHLICGRLTGYKFVSFRLMQWLWTRDGNGKIRLTKGGRLGGIAGQCLMEPCTDEKDFRFVLYNVGGSFANIITGMVFLVPIFFIEVNFIWIGLFAIGFSSALMGVLNLIPRVERGIPNDGANIREARKSDDAKHGLYVMLKSNAEMSKGRRLRDFDDNAFLVRNAADRTNYLVAYVTMLRSGQLEERGLYADSYRGLLMLNPAKLAPFYGIQVMLNMVFHELVYYGDDSSVQRVREFMKTKENDKMFQKMLHMEHPEFLPHHAAHKALLENDPAEARKLIAKTRHILPTLQNPGAEFSVTHMLDALELRLS